MPLAPTEIEELIAGTFELDALEMELRRTTDNSLVYAGPGFIKQSTGKQLEYTIYDVERAVDAKSTELPRIGVWMPDERLYDLHVRERCGRNWIAWRTEAHPSSVHGENGVVCRGEIDEITCSGKSYLKDEQDQLMLYFPGDFRLPHGVSLNVASTGNPQTVSLAGSNWVVTGPDYTLRFSKTEGGLHVSAHNPNGRFDERFGTRLEEVIWFVLAVRAHWSILQRHDPEGWRVTVRSKIERPASSRIQPPLRPEAADAAKWMGSMLVAYLNYVTPYTEPRYHPTSVMLQQTLLASATFIEMEALALGIAMEGLVRREYDNLGRPSDDSCKEIEAVIAFLQEWEGPPSLKRRIISSISGWKGTNPVNALRNLVEVGVVSEAQFSAWKKLRNTTAHGMEVKFSEVLVRECDLVYTAILRIIFSIIGYTGAYTDYATEGWPTVQFQPK